MGEVYKECGVETNSLKSFSDRVQEELLVFFTKVSIIVTSKKQMSGFSLFYRMVSKIEFYFA